MATAPESQGDGPQTMTGSVERVVYHDPRTRYTVLRLRVPGQDTLVTAVGRTPGLEAGAEVTVTGTWDVHPTHGPQLSFGAVHVAVPTSRGGIERRLMRYPGVKEVMAARIVARFGMDTLSILDKQPRRLLEVEGIGNKTLERILEHHETTHGPLAQLEAQLIELELPPHLGQAIHERYGEEALGMVQRRPYRLAREVRGIGFSTADRIARGLGIALDSDERLEAGLLHVLEQAESDGHCAVPIEGLVDRAVRALQVPDVLVRAAGERLVEMGDLVLEHGRDGMELCFPATMVAAERDVAEQLARLSRWPREVWEVPALPEHLSPGQREAVHAMAGAGVVVLTGGPGTGKSTVVHEILRLARGAGSDVLLAAPTGRAAKRLEQTTGHSASTIHRLLEVQPETGRFIHGPGNPLPLGLLVVDEISMLDIHLAQSLLDALTPEHRLLLVGDADQLPSVGPGNVLRDVMVAAEDPGSPIALVRLHEVFRQGEGSSIVVNAHRILAGERPVADPSGDGRGEFYVVSTRDPDRVHERVVRMATERIPQVYGLDPVHDIQVLCPMHKGRAGTEAFNVTLQAHHAAGRSALEYRGGGRTVLRRFCVGDRVMQTKNDYQKGVYNGDVGTVLALDPAEDAVDVSIDGVKHRYTGKELMALRLAYAVSIHKSQGSEFPAVIIPLLTEHHVMLRRNLLYTAVTRARSLCVLVGDPRAIDRAVRMVDAARRFTGLAGRLKDALRDPALFVARADDDGAGKALDGGSHEGLGRGPEPDRESALEPGPDGPTDLELDDDWLTEAPLGD
ncbi:SF1B family DNA helicase RecD2 [Paraliomyxa miuraensis]|uniref:SF1B family DNA helicase RecD2 n=1 Tax=Paraliomyxa miuraensis TaxID=376150 RepID=UPI00225C3659|nr:ATP-dependent RecD-like DNA helicase [Paraliomyxa miuraensis]MCX4245918.1 ATP-dependent RecD-like DNA helicase [Paraliomyxa miuraensis]